MTTPPPTDTIPASPRPRGTMAFDFDGTLSTQVDHYQGPTRTGDPIPLTVMALMRCLEAGYDVVIFTARADPGHPDAPAAIAAIRAWCVQHLGRAFPVTAIKHYSFVAMYDDRAIQLVPNTGVRVDGRDGQVPGLN